MGAPASRAVGRLQLTVIVNRETELRAGANEVRSLSGADISPLSKTLDKHGASLRPLFGLSEERMLHNAARVATDASLAHLTNYYRVDVAPERIHDIADELRRLPFVEAAYATPLPEANLTYDAAPLARESTTITPNFVSHQGYLDAGPGGIDVKKAWNRGGGTGRGVNIIHIGFAWRFTHEDLTQNPGGLLGGGENPSLDWRNFGTAILGMLCGADNGIGITGICPGATVSGMSFHNQGLEIAIRAAADRLQAGDIILITTTLQHAQGFIPVEWWPEYFEIIQYAIKRGILVVAAAGDSNLNLNDPVYNSADTHFPSGWANPFNRSNRDTGSILVGAGAPPPGTHGRDYGPDRSRLAFSNYGSMIDAQGWGNEVTTCGYGDLQNGASEDYLYTDKFRGTAAAAAMVCGALACAQGILRARGEPLLTPQLARDVLQKTGWSQQDAPGRPVSQRIGRRPNLADMLYVLLDERAKSVKDSKDLNDAKERKENKERQDKAKEWKDKDKEKEHKDYPPEKFKETSQELRSLHVGSSIIDRLETIEQAMSRLSHFISPDLRPDLAASALSHEDKYQSDIQGLSTDLQNRAYAAKTGKDTKDAKDADKPGEG